MSVYLVVASLFSIIIVAVAALSKKVSQMSASTDSLASAVASLSDATVRAVAKINELRAGQSDPVTTAAVDKAVLDLQTATAALVSAVG